MRPLLGRPALERRLLAQYKKPELWEPEDDSDYREDSSWYDWGQSWFTSCTVL